MRRSIAAIVILMGAILVTIGGGASPSSAQTSTLSGAITGASGGVASGVAVEALTANTTVVVVSTSTNSSGIYSLTLAPAVYDLRVTTPAAGTTPSSQSFVTGVVVGAGATFRDITVGSSIPVVSGHVTVNGYEIIGGSAFGANSGVLSGWFGGQFGGSQSPVLNVTFRKILGGGAFGNPIHARPMNGSYSVPVPPGSYEVSEVTFISDRASNGFATNPLTQISIVQLIRKTSNLIVNGNMTLPDANFSVVPFTVSLQNSDGTPGSGNIVLGPETVPADGSYSSVIRYQEGIGSVLAVAGMARLKVNFPYPQGLGPSDSFAPSTRRALLASSVFNLQSGGTAAVVLSSLPRVSGQLTLNGLSVVGGSTFAVGTGALQGWTVEGLDSPFPGAPNYSTTGLSITFTKPAASLNDFPLSIRATTATFDMPVEPGTYDIKYVLSLRKKSVPGSQMAVFTKYLSNVSVSADLVLPAVDFTAVPHRILLTSANGNSAVGAIALGEAQPAPAPHPDGIFYLSTGNGLSQYDPLVLAQPSSLKVTPSSSDPTIISSSTATPAASGTTTVVLSPLSAITGVLGIDGDPARLGSVITTPKLVGWKVEDTSGDGIFRAIGAGSSVSFKKHTAAGLASPIVFNPSAGNATFTVPLEAGTYDIVASLALSKWVVNGATSSQGLRYVTLKRHLYDVVVSASAATVLPPIDFAVSVHTVKLVKADGSPAAGLVEISAPAGTSNARSFDFVSYMVDPVTGLVDAVVFDDPAVLTVRPDIYNRTALATGPVTPINGRLTTVAFGSSSNVVVGSGDNDGDNIADDVEAQAPSHDANSDGIDDHTQANVASIPAGVQAAGSTGTAYVSVAVPAGLTLTNVQALPVPTGSAAPPAGTSLPEGLVKFVIPAVTPAADVTIRIYSSATNLTGYAKLFNGVWSQMPADRVTIGSGWVDVRITDNGIGDDDPVLGRISDPGAVIRGESNLPRTQSLGGPTTTTTLNTTTTTTVTPTTTTTSTVASVPTAVSATPLSFAPVVNPVSTTSPVATVTTTPGATQPTTATPGATTTLATIPAAVLVQATPIPPAPGPAQAGEAEPAFTGSNSIPLTLAGGLFVLFGYLMFWVTSHRGKATLKRLANRKKLDTLE